MAVDLDDKDRAILRLLREDAGAPVRGIGEAVGLSQPACWRRIERMERLGVFRRRVRLDPVKMGYEVSVFLGIKLAVRGRVALEDFERAVSAIPEVVLVSHVLGVFDYRLKIVARDLADFERILRRRIMTLPGVGDVDSNVVLSGEKDSGALV